MGFYSSYDVAIRATLTHSLQESTAMSESKIHHQSLPFTAYVQEQDRTLEVAPFAYEDFASCGLGVRYPNGKVQTWGVLSPRNLIASWRATEILRFLSRIEYGTLAAAYAAALREPSLDDQKTRKTIITQIGWETYAHIMSMPVPEEIIQAIIDSQDNDWPLDTWPIAQEVRAGTIEWRQDFADIDAKTNCHEVIVANFEKLLSSYASFCGLPRHCVDMGYVESALITIVDKAVPEPDAVVVGLAGLVGELTAGQKEGPGYHLDGDRRRKAPVVSQRAEPGGLRGTPAKAPRRALPPGAGQHRLLNHGSGRIPQGDPVRGCCYL
jgi:hypothetical protein